MLNMCPIVFMYYLTKTILVNVLMLVKNEIFEEILGLTTS